MTARHLIRIVQQIFDEAYHSMRKEKGEDSARKLQEASSHWLRHGHKYGNRTWEGFKKDLSEDLGHASMATTDTVYVKVKAANARRVVKSRKVI